MSAWDGLKEFGRNVGTGFLHTVHPLAVNVALIWYTAWNVAIRDSSMTVVELINLVGTIWLWAVLVGGGVVAVLYLHEVGYAVSQEEASAGADTSGTVIRVSPRGVEEKGGEDQGQA